MSESTKPRDLAVTVIAAVHLLAAVLHLVFWVAALGTLDSPASFVGVERAAAATTRGFGIADLLWSTPLLALAAVGLWRVRDWGWLCAQMAHALYAYSLTVVTTRDAYAGAVSPGTMLFGPFALFSFWATGALWRRRRRFFGASVPVG